jgi:hypothetical protein
LHTTQIENERIVIKLSDWYELVEGRDLEQGDILEDCPVFRIPVDLVLPLTEGEGLDLDIGTQDMIITSQSCDLVEGQKRGIEYVALSPLWPLSKLEKVDQFLGSTYGKEMCRRGNMHGYHMLAECDHVEWKREIGVVAFREVHSLPIDFLRSFAERAGRRCRVRSPYREHLAQAFARYFMRVGLPVDIPHFAVDKDERRAIERLETLDEETRRRVIDALGN